MPETQNCPKCGALLPANAPGGICPACLMQAGLASEQAAGSNPQLKPTTASTRFEPPAPEELAKHFSQFEVLELVGSGGMGAVYKARQRGLDRLVAVKILPSEFGRDPSFAERFTREARALARLSHSHIVSVYDFGQADGLFFIVMEYVDGVNLRQTIQSGGLTPQAAMTIVPQICEALQYAHDEGIVHRDIKPENILIDKKGRVKIADFGLAKLLGREATDHSLTGTHQVMGTLRYMAPEQMEASRAVDHRADIYSLGVVFYEMLTGELPLGRFAPPSEKVQVDVRLDEIVLRSLAREPERRYQQASEVKTDVEAISQSKTTGIEAARNQPVMLTPTRAWSAIEMFAAGITALAFLLAAVKGFFELAGSPCPLDAVAVFVTASAVIGAGILLVVCNIPPRPSPPDTLPELLIAVLALCAGSLPWTVLFDSPLAGWNFRHGAPYAILNLLLAVVLLVAPGKSQQWLRAATMLTIGLVGFALVMWFSIGPVQVIGGILFRNAEHSITGHRGHPGLFVAAAASFLTIVSGAVAIRAAALARGEASNASGWLGVAEWQRRLIKVVLVLVLIGGAGIFLFFDNVTYYQPDNPDGLRESFNRPYRHVEMGAFGPWLILDRPHLETKRNVTEIRWFSGSMAAGAAGLLALIALVIIRGLELSSDLDHSLAMARRVVQAPADGMILAACVSLLAAALMVYYGIDWNAGVPPNPDFPPNHPPPTVSMLILAASYVLSVVAQLTVAVQMRRLRWRTVLLLACFLTVTIQFVYTGLVFTDSTGLKGGALMPFALTGPLTLWATVTLLREDVRTAFEQAETSRTGENGNLAETLSGLIPLEQRVRAPAIVLLFNGLFAGVQGVALLVLVVLFLGGHQLSDRELVLISILGVALITAGIVICVGAWRMLQMRGYGWAVVAAILGQPMGMWSLVVLSRRDVKAAFAPLESTSDRPDSRGPGMGRSVLAIAICVALAFAAFFCGFLIYNGPLRSSGINTYTEFGTRSNELLVELLIALPIWLCSARATWRAIIGPRDAFDLARSPLIARESAIGKASLLIALAAVAAHAWPWMWLISPSGQSMTHSNFEDISALQSFWLLVLCLAAALFASVNSLAASAKTMLRSVSVIAAIVAFVFQIQFLLSLGEWEPGQVGKVVRLTRTYPKMGLYLTFTLTGLAVVLLVWRLFEECFVGAAKGVATSDEI